MSTGYGPTRRVHDINSQVSQDAFAVWKRQQAELITRRGEDPRNPDAEEAHNKNMLRHCLNAYICHMELDAYAGCLKKNGLWGARGDEYEVPTKAPMHQVKCPMPLEKYTKCIGSEENHRTLIGNGILNANCRPFHKTFFACIEVNKDKTIEDTERECTPAYRRLVRCGLNHLWEEYYRAVNNVGDQEDFQSFELHGDSKKREMFTTLVMDTQRRIEDGDTALADIYSRRMDPENEFKD